MPIPNKDCLDKNANSGNAKRIYSAPNLKIFGSVKELTKGPNTAPADANGTGGLFGAGGTS